MSFSHELAQLRHELKEAGVSFHLLCSRAGISPSTFTRWRGAGAPRLRTWERVKQARDELIQEAREGVSA